MSAALLQRNEKKVEISDELESFFNVILYHAVRYLDSNLTSKQVGIFIDEYFDQFKCYDGVWVCGDRKLQTIKDGLILSQSRNPVDFKGNMNAVIATMLSWFRANYIVQSYRFSLEDAPPPISPAPTPPSLPADFVLSFRGEVSAGPAEYRAPAPAPTTPHYTPSRPVVIPTAEDVEKARMVGTHDAFLNLLKRSTDSLAGWTPLDRVGDRYPVDMERNTRYVRLDREASPFVYQSTQ